MNGVNVESLELKMMLADGRVMTVDVPVRDLQDMSTTKEDFRRAVMEYFVGDPDCDLPEFERVWQQIEPRLADLSPCEALQLRRRSGG